MVELQKNNQVDLNGLPSQVCQSLTWSLSPRITWSALRYSWDFAYSGCNLQIAVFAEKLVYCKSMTTPRR